MSTLSSQRTGRDVPAVNAWASFQRLCRYIREYRLQLVALFVLLALCITCDLVMPLVIESAINAIRFGRGLSVDFRGLTFSLSMLLLLAVLNTAFGCAQEILCVKITQNMAKKLREEAFNSLTRSSVSDFESLRRGDLMSRLTNDVQLAAGTFTESFRELLSAAVVVAGCTAIMFVKCADLAVVSVGAAVVSVLLTGFLSGMLLPFFIQRQASLGSMNAHVEESLKTFRSCLLGGRIEENQRRMDERSLQFYRDSIRACRLEFIMGPLMLLLGNATYLLTLIYGLKLWSAGTITIGAIQAFLLYSRQFMEPLSSIGENLARAQNALAAAERVFAVIDRDPETKTIGAAAERRSAGISLPEENRAKNLGLCFENVRFAYHRNQPVLQGIQLAVGRGKRLALVGKTGVGKTTLTNLLLLFYPDYSGNVFLAGQEIRHMDPASVRRQIAVVSQEPQMVNGTLYENLTYGCDMVTTEEVNRLVALLGLDRLVARLPEGLDTVLCCNGEEMSQGEMQLICLGRAILRKTPVLILDEATSSLDPDTEQAIRRGMELAMQGRTCLIIAHRLSSVRDADAIAVLNDGVVEEYGSHRELMAIGGVYSRLYHTQFLGKEI